MVKECSDYLTKLKRAEKELKALSTAAEVRRGGRSPAVGRAVCASSARAPRCHTLPLLTGSHPTPTPGTQAALEGSKTVLESPLPHIFEDTAAAAGGAAKPVESIGGAQFSGEAVARVSAAGGWAGDVHQF